MDMTKKGAKEEANNKTYKLSELRSHMCSVFSASLNSPLLSLTNNNLKRKRVQIGGIME